MDSFGSWLILLVVLLAGLAAGWLVLRSRRDEPPASTNRATTQAPGPVPNQRAETASPSPADQPAPVPAEPASAVATEPVAATPDATADTPVSTGTDPTATPTAAPVETPAAVVDTPSTTPEIAEPASTPAVAEPASTPEVAEPVGTTEVAEPVGTTEVAEPVGTTVGSGAEPSAAVLEGPAEQADEDEPGVRPAVATPPVRRKAATKSSPSVAAKPSPAASSPSTDAAPATSVVEAADDFRRIQGVGPKMAAALHGAGIRTYQQLAELDETTLRETIRGAGLRATASLVTWPQQAKILASQPGETA
ncbi:hypothetical protein E0H26_09335 [Micromonospora zingiberis]|uniref:Helix-hairpin-helix domain-containing protein n=1 Tax=Micromonospora zingiberis TaxID=2053011 RepID=A0A4R0GNR9_9ACTN|nr:helix-hairpin-helix domain-containing protein [Micromonospora zingiberis]TCB98557.1 hypothetical protein E0H26_09335 [Micromonospora zingiberis]